MTIMASKNQVLNGLLKFIDSNMIPQAEGNYKIILRGAKAAIAIKFEDIYNNLKNNSLVAMTGVIDGDAVDLDTAARILQEALGTEEFHYTFSFLGKEYTFHVSADDIGILKSYIERA